jgi:hypothetical protein
MAKTPVNSALGTVRGKLDGWVYRQLEGQTIIAKPAARSDRPPTQPQLDAAERFRRAALFARGVFLDPVRKQSYRELATQRVGPTSRLFAFIVGDYVQPPVVTGIDASGYLRRLNDPIRVFATDDGEVTGVDLKLSVEDGTVIEEGPATLVDDAWRYLAKTLPGPISPITVTATARDRAGNETARAFVVPGTAPVVDEVDVSGYHGRINDPIIVSARDDVGVNEVVVTLRSAAGVELESGAALLIGGAYHYAAQTAIAPGTPVSVEGLASDVDAHSMAKTVNLVVS